MVNRRRRGVNDAGDRRDQQVCAERGDTLHAVQLARSEPTIRDVAARAGVSKSLVSLVLRQSPSVSEKSKEAVLKAAAELGYRANGLARRLVSGRTHTSGVLVTDLLNPFYAEVLQGISAAARFAAHRLLIVSGADAGEGAAAPHG